MSKVITEELMQEQLAIWADEQGILLDELMQVMQFKVNEVDGKITTEIQKIIEIGELDTTSLAEHIQALQELVGTVPEEFTTIINKLTENKQLITNVTDDLAAYKLLVAQQQLVQDQAIEANAQAITAVSEKATANESAIEIINGGVEVEGSTDKKISDAIANEIARTKEVIGLRADLTTEAKNNIVAAINELVTSIATVKGSTDGLAELVDRMIAGIGLNPDGTFTPVDGSDTLLEYIQDVNGDANSLLKALKKLARKSKQADLALNTAIEGLTSTVENQEDRIVVVENILNDLTDENGVVIQKGIVTRVADLEAKTDSMQEQIDDLIAGGGVDYTGTICGKKLINKTRLKLSAWGVSTIAETCPGDATPPPEEGGNGEF
jgi:hypothetical protein